MSQTYISVKEAGETLKVSPATIRNWVKLNIIKKHVKSENRLLISVSEIETLSEMIEQGQLAKLQQRRNKKAHYNKFVPNNYCQYRPYERIAVQIIEIAEKMESPLATDTILTYLIKRLLSEKGLSLSNIESILPKNFFEKLTLLNIDNTKCLQELEALNIPLIKGEDFLGLVYLSLRNVAAKQTTGSYYTPSKIVKDLVEASISQCEGKDSLRVVDPCCGSGNFLIALFLKLKDMLLQTGLELREVEEIIYRDMLWGFDYDETAVLLAKVNLLLLKESDLEDLNLNITKLDFLKDPRLLTETDETEPFFDVIIGNPPWGSHFSPDQLKNFKKVFATGDTGEAFAMFIEKGFSVLKDNGILSYVLPEAILKVNLHESCRELLLAYAIKEIKVLGSIFSNVFTPAITMVVKKVESSEDVLILFDNMQYRISQNRFEQNHGHLFDIWVKEHEEEIVRLIKQFPDKVFLADNADFALGIVTGNNSELIYNSKVEGSEVVLKGCDIFKYSYIPTDNYVIFTPEKFQQVAPEPFYRAKEKLIYRFINKNLVFAYDASGLLTLNSANILIPKLKDYDIKYILAYLNSSIAQFFHSMSFGSIKVLRRHLESIPIPAASYNKQQKVVALVNQLIKSKDRTIRERLYNEIDNLFFQLFCLSLKQREIIERKIVKSGHKFLYR